MSATTMLHVRIDQQTKDAASEALAAMGLTVSDAVRVLLHRIAAEKAFPFALRVPTAETAAAMQEAEEIVIGRRARFNDASGLLASLDHE